MLTQEQEEKYRNMSREEIDKEIIYTLRAKNGGKKPNKDEIQAARLFLFAYLNRK